MLVCWYEAEDIFVGPEILVMECRLHLLWAAFPEGRRLEMAALEPIARLATNRATFIEPIARHVVLRLFAWLVASTLPTNFRCHTKARGRNRH
jgi:hypothetical protein